MNYSKFTDTISLELYAIIMRYALHQVFKVKILINTLSSHENLIFYNKKNFFSLLPGTIII